MLTITVPEALSGSPVQQVTKMLDLLYQMQEELQYTLNNLGANNFNATELENLRVGNQLVMDYNGKSAGGIRLDGNGEGTENDAKYRMYLFTRNADGVPFALKLESDSRISMEARDMVYIGSDGDITIKAENIRLVGNVTVNGGAIT